MNLKIPFKVGLQIQVLVGFTLLFATATSLYLGSNILSEDKKAYVYDLTLSRVTAGAQRLEANLLEDTVKISHALQSQPLGPLASTGAAPSQPTSPSQENLADYVELHNFSGKLSSARQHGATAVSQALHDWAQAHYEKIPLRGEGPTRPHVGSPLAGMSQRLPVAFSLAPGKVAVFLWNTKDSELTQFSLHTPEGTPIASFGREAIPGEEAWLKTLPRDAVGAGIREWQKSNSEKWLIGYHRLIGGQLLAVGSVSHRAAFASVRDLQRRTTFLGGSIFLIALGLATLLSGRLARRMQELWETTHRMSNGDLKARARVRGIDQRVHIEDEVHGLSRAFNEMASQLERLFKENEIKARLEKELETAQLVQQQFLPSEPLKIEGLQLGGSSMSATECGGDWWGYKRVGDTVVVAIGDVTGHGAQAALLTAAAHGAFSVLMQNYELDLAQKPDPGKVIERMNEALYSSVHDEISMSFFCSVVDLEKMTISSANAAHRPGLILHSKHPEIDTAPMRALEPMASSSGCNLGESPKAIYARSESALEPGSIIFWYTDGLIECESENGKHWTKRELAEALRGAVQNRPEDPHGSAKDILERNLKFLAGRAKDRADDITVVVGYVPEKKIAESDDPGSVAA